MVERVPLQLLQQVAGIHEFQAQITVIGKDDLGGFQNLHRIVVMGEGIAAEHIHRSHPLTDAARHVAVEVTGDYVQAFGAGNVGDVLRDIDTDRLNTQLRQWLQEYAIIAAELHHTLRVEMRLEPSGVRGEMVDQRLDGLDENE